MADAVKRLLRQHVETWRHAAAELAKVRERELKEVDTREAVRQLFGDNTMVKDAPRRSSSGLVEQQMWFAKIHKGKMPRP